METKIKIVNIIASSKIKGHIDLELMSATYSDIVYEPEQFSGLIWRKKNPTITVILFSTGKISSHGGKSEKEAKGAIINTIKQLTKDNMIIGSNKLEKIEFVNIVGTGNLNKILDLENLSLTLDSCIYEPEQFPGLIYKPYNDSITCMLFTSGKINIVGAKSIEEVNQTYNKLIKKIKQLEGYDGLYRI